MRGACRVSGGSGAWAAVSVRRRIAVRPHPGGGSTVEAWVYFGGEPGFADAERHAGPVAEYTLDLAARLPINLP